MRTVELNGYIDEEAWFGDEVTPESLHALLYPEGADAQEDLRIILNSYGGSCNAAVRMFDDLRAYPGSVHIIVSGTAASAATVLATAADRLEMTPGSLWMIHDPSVAAWGNERDLEEAVRLLRACKESILNVYGQRCRRPRGEISAMMRDTTWMDAGAALRDGFIDGIVDMGSGAGQHRPLPRNEPRGGQGKGGGMAGAHAPIADAQKPGGTACGHCERNPYSGDTAGCRTGTGGQGAGCSCARRPRRPAQAAAGADHTDPTMIQEGNLMNKILAMREKRGEVWDKAKAFLNEHQDENGMLSPEDAAQYERMEQEVVDIGHAIEREERAAQMERELNAPTMAPLASRPEARPDSRTGRGSNEYKAAFWTAMRNRGGHLSSRTLCRSARTARAATSCPTNTSARWWTPCARRTACAACARSSARPPATARSRW